MECRSVGVMVTGNTFPLSVKPVSCHCEEVDNRRSKLITLEKIEIAAPSGPAMTNDGIEVLLY